MIFIIRLKMEDNYKTERTLTITLTDSLHDSELFSRFKIDYEYIYKSGSSLHTTRTSRFVNSNIGASNLVTAILKSISADRLFGNQQRLSDLKDMFVNTILGSKITFDLYDKQITPWYNIDTEKQKVIAVEIINNTRNHMLLGVYFKHNLFKRLLRRTNHYNACRNRVLKLKG